MIETTENSRGKLLWPALVAGVFALGVVLAVYRTVNVDVGLGLSNADMLLRGGRLYEDIIESNPPLVVYWFVPPVLAAQLLGVSAVPVFSVYMMLHLVVSYVLCARWVGVLLAEESHAARQALKFTSLWALSVFWPYESYFFGEREHIFFALALPYLLGAAAQTRDCTASRPLRWTTALLAGVGLAFKPFFLLVWVFVELYLAGVRGPRSLVRLENIVIAAVQAFYAALVLLLHPEYIDMARMIAPVYSRFAVNMRLVVLSRHPIFVVMALLVCLLAGARRKHARLRHVLAVAAVGALAAAFVQRKGWDYHFLPAAGFSIVLIGAVVVAILHDRRIVEWRLPPLARLTIPLAGLIVLVQAELQESWRDRSHAGGSPMAQLIRVARKEAAGGSIAAFSTNVGPAFPVVNYSNTRWALRFAHCWPLAGIYADAPGRDGTVIFHALDEMTEVEKWFFEGMIADLRKSRPELILVDCPERQNAFGGRRFDYVAYFIRDPRFEEFWRDYEPYGEMIGEYRVYKRR